MEHIWTAMLLYCSDSVIPPYNKKLINNLDKFAAFTTVLVIQRHRSTDVYSSIDEWMARMPMELMRRKWYEWSYVFIIRWRISHFIGRNMLLVIAYNISVASDGTNTSWIEL